MRSCEQCRTIFGRSYVFYCVDGADEAGVDVDAVVVDVDAVAGVDPEGTGAGAMMGFEAGEEGEDVSDGTAMEGFDDETRLVDPLAVGVLLKEDLEDPVEGFRQLSHCSG